MHTNSKYIGLENSLPLYWLLAYRACYVKIHAIQVYSTLCERLGSLGEYIFLSSPLLTPASILPLGYRVRIDHGFSHSLRRGFNRHIAMPTLLSKACNKSIFAFTSWPSRPADNRQYSPSTEIPSVATISHLEQDVWVYRSPKYGWAACHCLVYFGRST